MSNTKEIKKRIESVKNTQKITNAMYLISSTKMRKAKSELDKTRPYFNALQGEIKRIFKTAQNVESVYFESTDRQSENSKRSAILVITADKGLAGAYNQNVIKEAEALMSRHKSSKLFVVGEYGRQFCLQHHIHMDKTFLYTAKNPTMQRAREIATVLLNLFDTGAADRIYMIYTDLKNGIMEEAISTRLLPIRKKQFEYTDTDIPANTDFEFQPNAETLLKNVIPGYLSGFIYSALVDSFCSEQNARMTAMKAANDNAEKLLNALNLEYNLVRQAAITQEITEVTSGAKAQKRKRIKEKQKNEHRKNS